MQYVNMGIYEVARKLVPGDVIKQRVIMKDARHCRTETALVTEASYDPDNEQVNITYKPCKRPDSVQCGFGCTFFQPIDNPAHAAGKWGCQSLEVVGYQELGNARSYRGPNLYKNPGYDLVNM
jgi:hypothetical protein